MESTRLSTSFFLRDVLDVAPALLGKTLVRHYDDGEIRRFLITETEAYRGTEDLACHASRGKTGRNGVMFDKGGLVYVYFIYGMYWMLNFVTGREEDASAVLIRGLEGISGPGKVGRMLQLDRTFYGEDLAASQRIWVEESGLTLPYTSGPRVGVHYAREPWISMPWRYILKRTQD
jgi:DNA-3-methyladenine glycosylase